jgi:hypothetical protein
MDTVWTVIAGVCALAVLIGAGIPATRALRAKATIDLQAAELTAYKEAMSAQEQRFHQSLTDLEERCKSREQEQERRHTKEIAELRGQVEKLAPQFARTLATLVAAALREEGISA